MADAPHSKCGGGDFVWVRIPPPVPFFCSKGDRTTAEAGRGKALLVDGHSLVFRAYFAMPSLTTTGGVPTGAVHGFLAMLNRLLAEARPQYACVVFDRGRPQFRIDAMPSYKAQREAAPDDLRTQVDLLRDLLPKLHVPVIEVPGFEGDDLLGTLGRRLDAFGCEVLLVSGDRDLLQLAAPHITCLVTRKGIRDLGRYGPAEVEAEYGVSPDRIPEYKALAGDSSDNLPGVPGIGPKGARALLGTVTSLEQLLDGGGAATPRQRAALTVHREAALLQRQVATIRDDAPTDVAPTDLLYTPGIDPNGREQMMALDLRHTLDRWIVDQGVAPCAPAQTVAPEAPATVVSEAASVWGITPVVEGTPGARRLLRAFAASPAGDVIEIRADASEFPPQLAAVLAGATPVVGHHLKDLVAVALTHGMTVRAPIWDLEVAAYVADPGRSRYPLSALAEGWGLPAPETDGPSLAQFAQAAYRPSRANITEAGMLSVAEELEMPLIAVLAAMEERGLTVAPEELRVMDRELDLRIDTLASAIFKEAKGPFNINSPRQLADVLFGRLGLPVIKRTKTGPSTDADVLAELQGQHPVIELILTHRQLVKLRSTYVADLLSRVGEQATRIHTTFHQTVAATGRLSSSDPNLQNVPVRLPEGRRIRRAFIAAPGHVLVSADYSQIELRVLAHLSEDAALREAFHGGEDVHRATAAAVFGVAPSDVTVEMRRRAKAVNFGIVYGISDFGLARDLGIPVSEARAFIDAYFTRHPGVRAYLDECVNRARETGYTVTAFGRRRYLPDLHSRQRPVRSFAERTAMNSPIQGTAADIIKAAMVTLGPEVGPAGDIMVLQVHDELIAEVPDSGVEKTVSRLRDAMSGAMQLSVPLVVDVKVGRTWYDVRPWTGGPLPEEIAGSA